MISDGYHGCEDTRETEVQNDIIRVKHDTEDDDDDDIDTRCGLGSCHPSLLQKCNTPKFLCACLCAYTLVQGFAVNGINNVNTTSYERRFELSSATVGWVSSCFDMSAAICGVVIGFYGNQRNKGRVLTITFVVSSLGSLCMYLPHFITPKYEWGQGNTHMCSSTGPKEACSESDDGLHNYMALFILGQLMHGVGGSTLITVGYSFIDDSVPAASSPMYISLIGMFQMLGPMIGFLLGGALLNIYVDFEHVPKSEWVLTPTDPRWVGAWWVGFVLSSLMMFVFALPFSLFGSELPTAKRIRETRISETHNDGRPTKKLARLGDALSIHQFPVLLFHLLRNPAFMCVAFSSAFMGLVTVSLGTFLPKYIQNAFGISASSAATYAGLIIIPGAAIGQMFGGFVLRRWKLKVQTILKFIIVVVTLAALSKSCFLINCENVSPAEWDTKHSNSCNGGCNCDTNVYEVVCNQNGVKYFSPCLAGCKGVLNEKTFTDCSCIAPVNNVTSVSNENCQTPTCNPKLYAFLCLIFLSAFLVSASTVPALTVVLRCAHENERTFALGLLNFIARVIGTIPGPILYGAVIDSSCDIWGSNCGHRTSCWLYDNAKMGEYLALLGIGFTGLSVFFFFMAYKLYKPPVERKTEPVGLETDSVIGNEPEQMHANVGGAYGGVLASQDDIQVSRL